MIEKRDRGVTGLFPGGRRRRTRQVRYGVVAVGGDAPVSVQSMCTTAAADTVRTLGEIDSLARAGCEIVRVAVKDDADIAALPRIRDESPLPVIADIHFDYKLAVEAARAGIAGLRINPGNIGGDREVGAVIDAAVRAGIPVRVGVNAGSVERELRDLARSEPARALFESASRHRAMIEKMGFHDLVFSLKSSDPLVTIEANRLFASDNDYPLHLGVTEAGPALSGAARSAVALTVLLAEGIGDTVRVSLSGDPVREVIVASAVLSALGLREDVPEIVACPTCGRCRLGVAEIAERLERELLGVRQRIRIAVMGCEVNGPGEARDADIGIAGTRGGAVLFKEGTVVRTLKGNLLAELLKEINGLVEKH
jgi:(E)-4-hydroxy-3-methylbut-2-enyl-diphosphate synthase